MTLLKSRLPSSLFRTSLFVSGSTLLALLAAACSSMPIGKSDQDLAMRGPTVIDARTDPQTFELSHDLALKGAEVIANVQDLHSKIKTVKLSFSHIPLEIPMKRIAGNTWRTELSEQQLQKLAVDGSTMRYEAFVVATDQDGNVSTSPKPVQIAVKTPDLSQKGEG